MKRVILIIVCVLVVFGGISAVFKVKGSAAQKDIAGKIIRFHVIANSDSTEDQALKLKVRDNILKFISPKLKNSKSIEESRKILLENNAAMKKIAEDTVKENGYNYKVNTSLSKQAFPIKTYGNITLPQGEYEAYRIIIGSGKGQNWWCVMFPPLCFIDITKGEVSYKETENEMKRVLTDEEYKIVDNSKTLKDQEDKTEDSGEEVSLNNKDIKIKFKIVEFIKELFK